MGQRRYIVKTLPKYEENLEKAIYYISDVLQNQTAADKLNDDIQRAIEKRSKYPLIVRPYPSKKKRKVPFYPIYVRNYIVFYTIVGNIMEIQLLVYNKRNLDRIL